jgi:hypothetical protein
LLNHLRDRNAVRTIRISSRSARICAAGQPRPIVESPDLPAFLCWVTGTDRNILRSALVFSHDMARRSQKNAIGTGSDGLRHGWIALFHDWSGFQSRQTDWNPGESHFLRFARAPPSARPRSVSPPVVRLSSAALVTANREADECAPKRALAKIRLDSYSWLATCQPSRIASPIMRGRTQSPIL